MIRYAFAALAVALIPLATGAPAAAQDAEREFCADRPGKGTPTCILDVGRWQLEVGLVDGAVQRDDAVEVESWAVADTFVRYGLTRTTELQFGVTPYVSERVTDRLTDVSDRVDGISDITFGARHALTDPDGDGPVAAAIAGWISAPTGSDETTADQVEGGVVVPVAMPLSGGWGLSLSPGVDLVSDADGDGHHAAWAMVVGVDRPFGNWALGAEVWVGHDDDPLGSTTQSTFDLTAVWTPPFMADAQLDFGLNFGLDDDSPDVEFGVGVARRF